MWKLADAPEPNHKDAKARASKAIEAAKSKAKATPKVVHKKGKTHA